VSAPRHARSLFWALAGAFLLAALLGTLAQSFVALAVLRPLEARDFRARAELATARFATEFTALPDASDSTRIVELLRHVRAETELRAPLLFRAADGRLLSERPERARDMAEALGGAAPPRAAAAPSPREPRPRPTIVASRAVIWGGSRAGEVLVVRFPRPSREPGLHSADALLLSLPIALIASLLAALVVVRLLVRRLRALERLATRVAEGDLSARVDDARGDEIGRLAERLNLMAERLAVARGHLEEQDRKRRQLFADITHELATPLTSIRGYTETLLNPDVTASAEERTRYLNDMLAETRRLDRLIRDLLDLARMEAGAATLEPESLDWIALCRNVTQRFEPRFAGAGLRLGWGASPDEAWIEADGHRMVQVLENLLTNALRYVPAGGEVTLTMVRVPHAQRGPRFRLAVADDGPGIPADELPHLFERFYRAPGARANHGADEVGGSGLGLAIVREIVQRHAGTVRARSGSPRGLVIEVEIPARA
jgi:signal transduction histidine kinase